MDYGADGLSASIREFFGYFVKQFVPLVRTQLDKLYLARLDYPLLVVPIYLWAFIAIFAFWEKPTKWRAIHAAIPAGLLSYTYFHFWVYWTIVVGLLVGYTILFRRNDVERVRGMIIFLATFVVVLLPYIVNFIQFRSLRLDDYTIRLGVADGRVLGLAATGYAYIFYAALAILIYVIYWRRGNNNLALQNRAILFWIFLFGMVIAWNIQLIIGFTPSPNNWKRTFSPLLYIVSLSIMYQFLKNWAHKKIVTFALGALTLLVVAKATVNALVIWKNPELRILNTYSFPKDVTDSWEWLNHTLEGEPKILSSSLITSIYLNAYTSARPFLPIGHMTTVATNVLEERFLTAYKLFDVPREVVKKHLNSGTTVWRLYQHNFRRGDFTDYMIAPKSITNEYIESMLARYDALKTNWNSVDAEYVYVGPFEQEFSQKNFNQEYDLERVYSNSSVAVYKNLRYAGK